jgi:hypothetical protein
MGAAHPLVVTVAAELQMQLDHPSAEIIRSRATEVFSNGANAQTWLHRPREICNGRSPEQIIESGDVERKRDILKALIPSNSGPPVDRISVAPDTRQPFEYNTNKDNRWNPARTPMLYSAATVSLCGNVEQTRPFG